MNLYRPLAALTEWKPETERLSFVSELRDLGLQDAYYAHEAYRAAMCPVYVLAGPEFVNQQTGKKEQAGWVL